MWALNAFLVLLIDRWVYQEEDILGYAVGQ